jgi:hypothetical protein
MVVHLSLTQPQLALIEMLGNTEAYERDGEYYGAENSDYDDFDRKVIDDITARILNKIITSLTQNPVPINYFDELLTPGMERSANNNVKQRFGDVFHELVVHLMDGPKVTHATSTTVGYPIRNCLDKLLEHKIQNGTWDALYGEEDPDYATPRWDFVFDDDSDVIDSFVYMLKMFTIVLHRRM